MFKIANSMEPEFNSMYIMLRVFMFIFIHLTLKAPIATKVVCFSRLLKCLRSVNGKQGQSVLGPRCLLLYLIRQ